MAERKVLNKYYPPDFDPAKIPRRKKPKNQQITVRTMLPMSIRCSTCGNYIYKGTKFNSRQEYAIGESYLGIQTLRFYIKCTNCSAEITMKTDPQNSDYVLESGAVRNFEPWRADQEKDVEEMGDAIKSLENKRLRSKREMDTLSALDQIKSMKSRREIVTVDAMLEALKRRSAPVQEEKLEEKDESFIKSIFQRSRKLEDDVTFRKVSSKRKKVSPQVKLSVVKKVAGVKTHVNEKDEEDDKGKNTSNVLQSLCQHYDSDEECNKLIM